MQLKFTILGCGSSMGVPRPDGSFGKCSPTEKKNYRSRCSAIISSKYNNTLIDTSPDLRFQLLKNNIKKNRKIFNNYFQIYIKTNKQILIKRNNKSLCIF